MLTKNLYQAVVYKLAANVIANTDDEGIGALLGALKGKGLLTASLPGSVL